MLSPPQHYLFRYPFSNLFILIINYLKICETEVLLLLTAAANRYCYFFTVIVEDDWLATRVIYSMLLRAFTLIDNA